MTETASWYITFGIGSGYGDTYTEIRVPANLPLADQWERIRAAAFSRYGKNWAFDYPPESFEKSICRYGLTLREVVQA